MVVVAFSMKMHLKKMKVCWKMTNVVLGIIQQAILLSVCDRRKEILYSIG